MADELMLYEPILWEPETGCFLLEQHLARLERSAGHFGFPFDGHGVRSRLADFAVQLDRPRKVRVWLGSDGELTVESEDVKPSTPIPVALAGQPVDSSDPFLRHKTSRREVYDRELGAHPEAKDVLLWNERRELTETCHGNVVLEISGRRLTPPLSAGLLPGTFRAHLLAQGAIEAVPLGLADLKRAERIFMINSVRKWCEARLVS